MRQHETTHTTGWRSGGIVRRMSEPIGFGLSEQHQMVQGMVRQWCERTLLPKVPALEAGEEQPWDLMRQFSKTFGLDQMASSGVKKRMARLREQPDAAGDPRDELVDAAGADPMM